MGMYENPPYYISAYGLALKRGFVGTLDEWLAGLVGPTGPQVSDGKLFEQETANYLSDRREKKQHKVGKQHRWSKEMANCKGEQIPP